MYDGGENSMSIKSNEFMNQMKHDSETSFRLAIVTEVTESELYLTFYGEDTQSEKTYKMLSNYKPVVGDTVCVARINESWLVLGKVSNQYIPQSVSSHYLENTASGSSMKLSLIYYSDTTFEHVFRASTSGRVDLGSSSYKFQDIYATNGTIQTSDQREKQEIQFLDTRYLELFQKLLPKSFRFVDGRSGRKHVGFISQEVETAMSECGISDLEFAGFIKSPVYEVVDGKETDNIVDYIYGLRYEEFIGILTFVIQDVISFLKEFGYRKDEGGNEN